MPNQQSEDSGLSGKISELKRRTQRLDSLLVKLNEMGRQLYMDLSIKKCVIERAAEGICACHEIPEHPFIRFTLWNPRMSEITGYSMKQINRQGWYQTMYPDRKMQEKARQRMAKMRDNDDLHYERWVITRADGVKRTLRISTSILGKAGIDTQVIGLMQDITDSEELAELKIAEQALKKTMAQLEKEVEQRTEAESRLLEANRTLEQKVISRTVVLEETNAALKVILDQREKDKRALAESIMANLNELVHPYLKQLSQTPMNARQTTLLEILQDNLTQVTRPFASQLTSSHFNLTPMEMKVADLIRNGQSNKEIAEILGVSPNTILTHRYHIRNKLDLKNKKVNLRSFLKSLQK